MPVDSRHDPDRRRLKRRLNFWRVVTLLLVIGLGLWLFVDWQSATPGDHIARLDITEIIVEDDRRQEAIDHIEHDPSAKALIVYINSPGGSTYGSEILYKSLRRVSEAKPVVTVIGTVGASGGYLAALAGERIFAGESSIVGSIGVMVQLTEVSELMKKVGVSATAITSGELKGEPSPFKPLSAAARENLQSMVSATYDWFLALVTDRRPIAEADARQLADGRVMIGLIAVENGLVDEIGGLQEARGWLESERGIAQGLPVRSIDYSEPKPLIARLFSQMMGKSVLSERLTLDGLLSLWQPE